MIVGTAKRRTKTAFVSFILVLSTLNKVSFTTINSVFVWMESGGFDNGNFGAVTGLTKRIFLFKICLSRGPFHSVVRHLEYCCIHVLLKWSHFLSWEVVLPTSACSWPLSHNGEETQQICWISLLRLLNVPVKIHVALSRLVAAPVHRLNLLIYCFTWLMVINNL